MSKQLPYIALYCTFSLWNFRFSKHSIFEYSLTPNKTLSFFILICFEVKENRYISYKSTYCVCLKSKTLCMCALSLSSFLFPLLFRNVREFGAIRYFTGHWMANTIQLFVAIKGNVYGVLFFRKSHSERRFPRDYLIDYCSHLFTSISLK